MIITIKILRTQFTKKVLSRNRTGNKKGVCHVLRDVNRKRFESSKVEDSL